MNQIATQQQAPAIRERIEVIDAVPILDTSRFEHMQRVATVMARSTLMPESLYMTGKKDDKEQLPYEQIMSNCFLVVNQAVRWGLDPFAVAQCVSVVHGKLCYEGKLVSAVLQAKMGMSLHHHLTGEGDAMRVYLSDRPFSEQIIAELRPGYRRQDMRIFDGSVAEWRTTGAGTPWTAKNFPRMLIYRGTRDWCRIYESALMLGVYTDDELGDMEENSRYRAARDVTPAQPSVMDRLKAQNTTQEPQGEREGFSRAFIADQTDERSDALTGEILDNTNSAIADPAPSGVSPDTDEEGPASSTEDGGEVVSPSASSPSSPISPDETAVLIRYARDVLPRAARPDSSSATMSAIEHRWASDLSKLSPEGKDGARAISQSMRRIMEDPATLEGIIEHYTFVLGCTSEDLGG
jgi:hypothetical protein